MKVTGMYGNTAPVAAVASWFVCFRDDTCTAIKSQASEILGIFCSSKCLSLRDLKSESFGKSME